MLDQLRQIAIFAKTIDHGSFRGAARELNLSPSVVSHHISQLEEHLGVALLYRTTRKLSLTREGERLLVSTHPMFAAVEEALSELSTEATSPAGELHLAMPSILCRSPLTDKLAEFSMRYPGIKLLLDYSDERQDLIAGGYDIAIRMGLTSKNSVTSRTLHTVERRFIASTAYLKNRPKAKTPQDTASWDWITLTPVHHVRPTFKKPKSKPVTLKINAHVTANNAMAVYYLARAGAGVAVVPEFLTSEAVDSGDIKYILPDWTLDPINVFATWPSNAPKHGLIKLLIDEISPNQSLR